MNRRLTSILAQAKAHPLRVALAVTPLVAVALVVLFPNLAHASDLENATLSLMNAIFSFFMSIFGKLLVLFTEVLVYIATYSNITDVEAVKVGWAVVRDLANMGFIVAMLLISFGTIFRFQEYRYSRLLGKLIIMAILINFSRLIASLLVDFSQVVMLTFVNAFRDLAAGKITDGFGVANIVAFSQTASAEGGDINLLSVLGAMFAGIVMLFIATAIVASFVVFLVQRMIMLWIYIILSPLAYMMAVLPGSLGRFWGGWWDTFMKYLIRGPVIGFYLWLAFTIASFTNNNFTSGSPTSSVDLLGTNSGVTNSSVAYFANQASTGANVLNYVVFAALLVAGLQQAAAAGGVAGKMAGKSMATFEKWGSNLGKGAGALALAPVKYAGDVAKRPAVSAAEKTLGFMSKMPIIGGAAMAMNSRLRNKSQRADDAQAKMVENLSASELINLGTGSAVSATAAARRKVAIEKLMNTGQLSKANDVQRANMLAQYEKDIGMTIKEDSNGKLSDFATDQQGLKIYKEYLKKNPTRMGDHMLEARRAGNRPLAAYWQKRIENSAESLRPNDIAEMSDSAWYDSGASVPTAFGLLAAPILQRRASTNADFLKRVRQEAPASNIASMNNALGYTYFQAGAGGVKLATPGAIPEAPQQSRRAAAQAKITGLRSFGAGSENMLGIDKETAKQILGVQNIHGATLGGAQKNKAAADVGNILDEQIADIDKQLVKNAEEQSEAQRMVLAPKEQATRLEELAKEKTRLERERATISTAQQRLADPDKLKSLQFVVRDRDEGAFGNLKAEEEMHESLEMIDPDRSLRNQIIDTMFTAEERANITEKAQEEDPNRYISIEHAFDEYFAKGLANSGKYGGNAPDSVKLKNGLDLMFRRQAEAKGVKLRFVGGGQEQAKAPQSEFVDKEAEMKYLDAEQERLDTSYTQGEQQLAQLKARMVETKAAANRVRLGEAGRRYEAEAKQAEEEYNAFGKQFNEIESQWKANTVKRKNVQSATTRSTRGTSPTATLPERYERAQAAAATVAPVADAIPPAPQNAAEEAGTTNITNNIRNEITQVVKSAPQGFRDTMKLTSTSLDSAMRSSLVMKSLMTNLRNGFESMQKSVKSDDTKKYLGKRMAELEQHVDGNDVEGFREDFGKLQKEFESIIE